MRAPTERDQCQAKLDALIEGFMRADWAAYGDAVAWLRDFADQTNSDAGRVMSGGHWFTPQTIEALRERARSAEARKRDCNADTVITNYRRHPRQFA
jgi:hypothetical protein